MQPKRMLLVAALLLVSSIFFVSCQQSPYTEQGTNVKTTSATEFPALAKRMIPLLDCKRIDCCFLDGIETSCAFVQACLDAGFCQVVAQD